MAVEFDLRNSEHLVRPGSFAHVSIELDSHAGALVLPASALVMEKKKAFIFVVRDGAARKVPVKIGYDDGIEFEVSEGISETDEVIVTGKSLVADGETVRTSRRQ
jgi:multidrug efflux pump subunit AcrA (membrane-fusion protein)